MGLPYSGSMTHVLWVKLEQSDVIPNAELRWRVGVVDPTVVVEICSIGRWEIAGIPAGARDESGQILPHMSIGHSELPPHGRVYLVPEQSGLADLTDTV